MRFSLPCLLASLIAVFQVSAATDFSDEQIAFFKEEVKPILQSNCFKCHGGLDKNGKVKIRSGLQLISRRGIVNGGSLGPAYDPEHPNESLLLQMLSYEDDEHQMPPSGKLPDSELRTLTRWVTMGLPWTPEDADRLVEVEEDEGHHLRTKINDFTKSYWSYKPLKRPSIPEDTDAQWSTNPIDAFIFRKLKKQGLSPNPPADPRALVRRAYHNVTGLPPSPEEVDREAKNLGGTRGYLARVSTLW